MVEDAGVPYLRLTCPPLTDDRQRRVAEELTAVVVELFTPPRGPSADDIRARTTVHFATYGPDQLFVGGRAATTEDPDVTVELSDWSMSTRRQARVAARLTPVLVGRPRGGRRAAGRWTTTTAWLRQLLAGAVGA